MRIRRGPRCQTDGVLTLQQHQAATNLHSAAAACGVNRRPQEPVGNLGISGTQEENIVGASVAVAAGDDRRTGDADLLVTAKAASLVYNGLFRNDVLLISAMDADDGKGWDGMVVDLTSGGGLATLLVCTRILCVGWLPVVVGGVWAVIRWLWRLLDYGLFMSVGG